MTRLWLCGTIQASKHNCALFTTEYNNISVLYGMPDGDVTVSAEFESDGRFLVDSYKAAGIYPTQDGKVFAGWYADEAFTTPYTEAAGFAYAKFVDDDVHKTMAQLSVETTAESDATTIRFATTIDSLN